MSTVTTIPNTRSWMGGSPNASRRWLVRRLKQIIKAQDRRHPSSPAIVGYNPYRR
ncbi:MAG: hypothetical protein AAB447_03255 [Patescibacteria group bacterium]